MRGQRAAAARRPPTTATPTSNPRPPLPPAWPLMHGQWQVYTAWHSLLGCHPATPVLSALAFLTCLPAHPLPCAPAAATSTPSCTCGCPT